MDAYPPTCTPVRKIRLHLAGTSIHRLYPSTDEVVHNMRAMRHVANSQTTSFSAQLLHTASGFLRVALGWRYDPHHEFPPRRLGWSLWILRSHQRSGTG